MSKAKISPKQAIRQLWERGARKWKLHAVQKQMYDAIASSDDDLVVIASARRLGKSFMLCLLASEECKKGPNRIVKYICPRKSMVRTIIQPIMTEIFKDCPPELKPEYKDNIKAYLFPNGSQIQMAGTDNGHHESIRGGFSHLCIVDEAGFCDELKYVVESVLQPTTDTTNGKTILASTPSKTWDHDFVKEYMEPAQVDDKLLKYTIYDNPMLSEEKIQKIVDRHRMGVEDPAFKREYLCEVSPDLDLQVVPEFTDEVMEDTIKEWPRPPYYDAYTAMDIGYRDLTVVLFAYYDFKNSVLIVEDELVINGSQATPNYLSFKIKEIEERLWTDPVSKERKTPYTRVCDNNLILINDLQINYDLTFFATRKDKAEEAINNMRVWISDRRVIINPRCTTLINHLKTATWKPNRKEFERIKGKY